MLEQLPHFSQKALLSGDFTAEFELQVGNKSAMSRPMEIDLLQENGTHTLMKVCLCLNAWVYGYFVIGIAFLPIM